MDYEKVFKALNKAKVKYVIAGGIAVVLHGFMRLTNDLDLIVFLQKQNLGKFFDALKRIGYMPKVPVTKEQFQDHQQRAMWKKEKGMIVFSFVHRNPPFEMIDMFVDEPIKFDEIYRLHEKIKLKSVVVPVIGVDHLIRLKQKASRPKDLDDIVQLKHIKEYRQRE
jgi:hypothetical protein